MKQGYKWLGRRISAPGPCLALCLSEKEYLHAMRHMEVSCPDQWMKTPQANATAHHFSNNGKLIVVVCLGDTSGRNAVEIAGLLVHEAVHAWQEWCNFYGEDAPGKEQEAYAIQSLSQELMAEYARRLRNEI